MMNQERFVVVWLPSLGSRLADLGAAWTGWCPETGLRVEGISQPGAVLSGRGARLTGLHAPILGPFGLRPSVSRWELSDVLAGLAEALPVIDDVHLAVSADADRLELVSTSDPRAWRRLAAHVAHALTRLVQTPPPAPWRRLAFELTGDLPELGPRALAGFAERHFADTLGRPIPVCNIALLSDHGEGRHWRLVERHLLAGDTANSSQLGSMACMGPSTMAPLESMLTN